MPPFHSKKSNEEDTSLKSIASELLGTYLKETPAKLKLVDSFMLFYFLCGITIFVYCVLVTPYPFHTFLSALFSCIGCFILSGIFNFLTSFSFFFSLSFSLSLSFNNFIAIIILSLVSRSTNHLFLETILINI